MGISKLLTQALTNAGHTMIPGSILIHTTASKIYLISGRRQVRGTFLLPLALDLQFTWLQNLWQAALPTLLHHRSFLLLQLFGQNVFWDRGSRDWLPPLCAYGLCLEENSVLRSGEIPVLRKPQVLSLGPISLCFSDKPHSGRGKGYVAGWFSCISLISAQLDPV